MRKRGRLEDDESCDERKKILVMDHEVNMRPCAFADCNSKVNGEGVVTKAGEKRPQSARHMMPSERDLLRLTKDGSRSYLRIDSRT